MTKSVKGIQRHTMAAVVFLLFALISPLSAQQQDSGSPDISMSEMMRGPENTALFPTLISPDEPTPEERKLLESQARQWVSEGVEIMTQGAAALAEATQKEDLAAMRLAGGQIGEGLSRLESGLSASQALAQGKPSADVALDWLKLQLNLQDNLVAPRQRQILGMAPFQLFICLLMLVAIGISLAIYLLRMRRAYHLLERIEAGKTTETGSQVQDVNLASADMASTKEGLLPIQRKKLCRLRVARIFPETPDVKTFRFVCCDNGPIPFSYLPGQFMTLTLPLEGHPIKRSYTISSSPTQGYYCEITVKREQYGAGSRYLHDVLEEGNTLDVRGPSGKLTFTGKEADSIVLIGGGVGITPVMSVTRALTDMGWKGEIILIVCCSDPDHLIFGAELIRLQERNSNLHVHVAMSSLQEDHPDYYRGRLSKEALLEWIPDIASRPRFHMCASPNFMDALQQMLAELGVASDCIKTESFGSLQKPHAREETHTAQASDQPVTSIEFKLSEKSTDIDGDETILEAAERIGIDLNYSCRVGSCGECSVKIVSGEVEMEVEDALEPADKAANIILACQARPTSNVVIEA